MNRVTPGDGEEYEKYYITEVAQQKGSEGKAETKGSSTDNRVEIQTDQIGISKLKTPNPNSTLETIFAKIKATFLRKPDLSKKLTEEQTRELEEAKGKVKQFKKDIEHFHPLTHNNDKQKRADAKENFKTAKHNLRLAEAKLSRLETKIYKEQKEELARSKLESPEENEYEMVSPKSSESAPPRHLREILETRKSSVSKIPVGNLSEILDDLPELKILDRPKSNEAIESPLNNAERRLKAPKSYEEKLEAAKENVKMWEDNVEKARKFEMKCLFNEEFYDQQAEAKKQMEDAEAFLASAKRTLNELNRLNPNK